MFEYNFVGKLTRIESSEALPTGASTLRLEFQKNGAVALLVNDKQVATGMIPRTLPFVISWEGFDIGRDSLSPVSLNYQDKGEFPFTGKLNKVVLEIK